MESMKRVALVTGASAGVGAATAIRLAQEGRDLVLWDLSNEKLAATKSECEKYGAKVKTYACDISNEEMVNAAAADAIQAFGKVDILVNNAALWRDASAFLDTSVDMWKQYLAVNVMGTVYVTRAVLPQMIANNYGRIVNVASVAGVYGNANMACYSATKGAVISFTKALAKEVAQSGVTVNSISPGTVSAFHSDDPNHTVTHPASYMGRSGSAMENAELICFLCGDKAPYISGENIQIDGCRKII